MPGAGYTWSLSAIAAAVGVVLLWAFRRFSDQPRIALAKRKVRAHLLAFRLFADEPAMIFRAQSQLLRWNLRYLALMLKPALITMIPLAALLFHLDAVYGRRALRVGETAIVTARVADPAALNMLALTAVGPGIAVETPALRVPQEQSVCWRVRALANAPGAVRLATPGGAMLKRVQAGAAGWYISARRVASLHEWLCNPGEARLPDGAVRSIDVEYPSAEIGVCGFGMHWLVWFCVVSFAVMLVLRKRLGVTF